MCCRACIISVTCELEAHFWGPGPEGPPHYSRDKLAASLGAHCHPPPPPVQRQLSLRVLLPWYSLNNIKHRRVWWGGTRSSTNLQGCQIHQPPTPPSPPHPRINLVSASLVIYYFNTVAIFSHHTWRDFTEPLTTDVKWINNQMNEWWVSTKSVSGYKILFSTWWKHLWWQFQPAVFMMPHIDLGMFFPTHLSERTGGHFLVFPSVHVRSENRTNIMLWFERKHALHGTVMWGVINVSYILIFPLS